MACAACSVFKSDKGQNGVAGGCSTGGCNRLNTFDWLSHFTMPSVGNACKVIEVSFNRGSRKDFFLNTTRYVFEKGDLVTVEGVGGFDVGEVSLTGEIVRLQLKKKGVSEHDEEMKKVLRKASFKDLEIWKKNKAREPEALIRSRAIARRMNLDMKITEVEIQADGKKATFYYIADGRVDFRELIKVYAAEFRVKVEMRQIGSRQEAGKVGGIGSCGRELCCSSWLTDFKSVTTAAARYQNLSLNQSKLSGLCGRLKCCLNYELDLYLEALQHFPEDCDVLKLAKGEASLVKKDIFNNVMWYALPESNKQLSLTIEQVKKIKALNEQGVIPEAPEEAEPAVQKKTEKESGAVELVGQISLRALERAEKRKKMKQKKSRRKKGNNNTD
ncbi:MAG: hypothetical protein N2747_01765 [Chitinophagaceae bacterium]|nr:hypothetical protein [Chitinophagaceae bacterium]